MSGGAVTGTESRRTWVTLLYAAVAVCTGVYVVSLVPGVRPAGVGYVPALDFGVSVLVMLLASACCTVRAVRDGDERWAWFSAAAAIGVYAFGDVYYYLRLVDLPDEQMPFPSPADAGWLAFYPLLVAALVGLVRSRLAAAPRSLWLDGLGAGAGAAAVVGALVLRPLLGVTEGSPLAVATNLAYPAADLALMVVAVAALHLYGWRPDRTWTGVIVGGCVLMAGDIVYLLQVAHGTYVDGGLLDATWPVACVCFALAAAGRPADRTPHRTGQSVLAVPVVLSLAGTAVLVLMATSTDRLPALVAALAAASVLSASGRLLLTLRDTRRLADVLREARTDELTGLPNRRELVHRLDRLVGVEDAASSDDALLLIDLDRFKEVNDTLGHDHGDELLRAVAGRLASVFRDGDTIARLGGDEFAVLLPAVQGRSVAEALARRCTVALEDDFVVQGISLRVEASVGLALAPEHGRTASALLRAADVAMYEAKAGGGGVAVYEADNDVHTPSRLSLLGDLRRALQSDELELYYQPKVDVRTKAVLGVEALVRWNHPTRGRLLPADFIPAAESTGLIVPLTDHVLRLAIAEAHGWALLGRPLQVAVNLSPRCLSDADLPARVGGMLAEHGLPADLLRLEVTETMLMLDPTRALSILTDLKSLGVRLSIDDFGVGYSSMSQLNLLPVDELKIDRTFVLAMLADSGNDVLVRSSIELGHSLGLAVVAEGVEDEATLTALTELGCDVAQGFHLARPMESGRVLGWIASQDRQHRDDPVPA